MTPSTVTTIPREWSTQFCNPSSSEVELDESSAEMSEDAGDTSEDEEDFSEDVDEADIVEDDNRAPVGDPPNLFDKEL